jgi:hypothetical protein
MTPRKWWSVAILNKRRSWGRWFANRVEARRLRSIASGAALYEHQPRRPVRRIDGCST